MQAALQQYVKPIEQNPQNAIVLIGDAFDL